MTSNLFIPSFPRRRESKSKEKCMILGVGIDLVSVERFKRWTTYSPAQLARVFSDAELCDCTDAAGVLDPAKLATRFAAKEAFFKALSAALVNLDKTEQTFSLLWLCRHAQVKLGTWGVPVLVVDWAAIEQHIGSPLSKTAVHLSLSHEKEYACAVVDLECADPAQ